MALDFPNTPTLNQMYTAPNGVVWKWDGAKWVSGLTPASVYASIPYVDAGDAANATSDAMTRAMLQNNNGRNKIDNARFDVWQHGVGPFTTATIAADRWTSSFTGGTMSTSQALFGDVGRAQIGDEWANAYMITTIAGGAAAGNFSAFTQAIEYVRRLSGKTVIVSFWASAPSGNPKIGINFLQIFGSGGSPSAAVQALPVGIPVTINANWQRYSAVITLPSTAGKVLGSNSDDTSMLQLWFSSGATNNAFSGNIGVQSSTIAIWGVQVEVAAPGQTQPSALEQMRFDDDFARCQRFFQTGFVSATGYNAAGGVTSGMMLLPVRMRAAPVPTASNITYSNASALILAGGWNGVAISYQYTTTATGNASVLANIALSSEL